MPTIVVLVFAFSREELAGQIAEQTSLRHTVAVEGTANAEELVRFMGSRNLDVRAVEDAPAAVRDERAPVGVVIGRGFQRELRRNGRADVTILTGDRSFRSQFGQLAVRDALDAFSRRIVRGRLRAAGIPPRAAEAIRVVERDLASAAERTGSLLGEFLPLMVIAQVIGVMSGVATDMTVGEKERRTVEALLATPLTRREVALGKWLITMSIGSVAALLTLTVGVLAFRYTGASALVDTARFLPPGAYARAALGVVGLVIVYSSVQLLVGFWARSSQQAGIVLSPLFFLAFIPLFLFEGQSGSSIATWLYATPVLGPVLLAKNGLAGTAATVAPLIATVTSIAYAAGVLVLADRVFHSERALLRASG
jgi:sodium transport system permease protein